MSNKFESHAQKRKLLRAKELCERELFKKKIRKLTAFFKTNEKEGRSTGGEAINSGSSVQDGEFC